MPHPADAKKASKLELELVTARNATKQAKRLAEVAIEIVNDLRYKDGGCWCLKQPDTSMFKKHTKECEAAQRLCGDIF